MIDYFITNLIICITAITSIYLLKGAPARLRFYVAIFAVIGWFIPWNVVSTLPMLSNPLSPYINEVSNNIQSLEFEYGLNTVTSTQSYIQSIISKTNDNNLWSLLSFGSAFFILLSIGLFLFIKTIWNYYFQIEKWKYHSVLANHYWQDHGFDNPNIEIRITEHCSLAMATGFIKPTIWLSNTKQQENQIKTILTHEINHIKQHDPLWMWLLTFAQCLFWWNPVLLYLIAVARNQIELSCDEKCHAQLKEQYSQDLALIILKNSRITKTSIPAVSITNSSNFNIKRIKNLTNESKMKTKYILTIVIAFAMSSIAVAAITEKPTENSKQQSITKKNEKKKLRIYNDNALHNELIDELLAITKQAKTTDPIILNDIHEQLVRWNTNRPTTSDTKSERSLKLISFTILSYVLDKLEKHKEILTSFEVMYPKTSMKKVLFLKNHLSMAHIKVGEATKAIELMQDVIKRQPKPKVGSLFILAHAHLANNDGKSAIDIVEQIESSTDNNIAKIQALNLKRKAYVTMGNTKKANEIHSTLKSKYDFEGRTPQLMLMASPILAYLPEAS
ncbi:MAG: hypothetical protein HRT38_11915 [Alteromonadaceae bacterium]|nr:hypothetical protein [Alteromonadaceae bacterium]